MASSLEGWRIRGKTLEKTYRFDAYWQCVRFFNRIAALAEKIQHHPDALVSYGKVVIRLTTHDAGGLTARDFRMAKLIDRLEKKHVGKTTG
jgi:4a-hydroxytetrahydrobiopterin dehydratase